MFRHADSYRNDDFYQVWREILTTMEYLWCVNVIIIINIVIMFPWLQHWLQSLEKMNDESVWPITMLWDMIWWSKRSITNHFPELGKLVKVLSVGFIDTLDTILISELPSLNQSLPRKFNRLYKHCCWEWRESLTHSLEELAKLILVTTSPVCSSLCILEKSFYSVLIMDQRQTRSPTTECNDLTRISDKWLSE